MSLVFVSYSRKDQEFVLKLCADLKREGVVVWLDQFDLIGGQAWDVAIENALEKATHLLLVLSKSSVDSQNVRNEVGAALDKGKIVVPIMIENCTPPLRVYSLQQIDFRSDYEAGFRKILSLLPKSNSASDIEPRSGTSDELSLIEEFKQGLLTDAEVGNDATAAIVGIKHILIVEDTTELAEVVQATMEGRIGLPSYHETHGKEAIAFLKQNRPELIFLDIGLPDMTGWSVMERIKEIYPANPPPVIVITAYGDPANKLVGKLEGVKGYITKPFTPDEAEEAARKVLNSYG